MTSCFVYEGPSLAPGQQEYRNGHLGAIRHGKAYSLRKTFIISSIAGARPQSSLLASVPGDSHHRALEPHRRPWEKRNQASLAPKIEEVRLSCQRVECAFRRVLTGTFRASRRGRGIDWIPVLRSCGCCLCPSRLVLPKVTPVGPLGREINSCVRSQGLLPVKFKIKGEFSSVGGDGFPAAIAEVYPRPPERSPYNGATCIPAPQRQPGSRADLEQAFVLSKASQTARQAAASRLWSPRCRGLARPGNRPSHWRRSASEVDRWAASPLCQMPLTITWSGWAVI